MLPLFHADEVQAFLPVAVPYYEDLKSRGRLHRYALHVRSSQAFALNLFAPLTQEGLVSVLHLLGLPAVHAEGPEFEYEDVADTLAEARPASPHRTQVDVVLRGHDAQHRKLVALVEVKFTETDFSGCSAYTNPVNPWRDNCHSPGLFGANPEQCFQLKNHGNGHRNYDTYLAGIPVSAPKGPSGDGGCLVRTSLNQPMRNLALAHMLHATGEADQVVYGLTAPAEHQVIWRRFSEVQAAFPDTGTRSIVALPAGVVADRHPDGGGQFRLHYPQLMAGKLGGSQAPGSVGAGIYRTSPKSKAHMIVNADGVGAYVNRRGERISLSARQVQKKFDLGMSIPDPSRRNDDI